MANLDEWSERLKTPSVIMGVGIPGSGKTTILEKLSRVAGITIVSPDQIRQEITGSVSDQTKNRRVWNETYARVAKKLAEERSVIVDATHANHAQRIDGIRFYRNSGAIMVGAVVLKTPLKEAIGRNNLRDRRVPTDVLVRMDRSLANQPTSIDDGFDTIYVVRPSDDHSYLDTDVV